ncbi:endonuclease/exonuclease/phosphatase family protein [Kitasatospora sp. NPDC059327]|uniref:endonuclease/exonuclease/phosphatase family protein n=1 Tax=Kitasatospora sp. NPDC059327 TaxID=3346803 RepID=UPI0036805BA8
MRIANFNLYKASPSEVGTDRWQDRVTAIRELAPDILTVQEILVDEVPDPQDWDRAAAEVVRRLAADCGLVCEVPRRGTAGVAAAASFRRPWYTAVLWNPAVAAPVPNGFLAYGAPDFWHGLATVRLDVGVAEPFLVASYHGDPFRPDFRANEALRLKGLLRRTGGAKVGLVAGDFNSISAATGPGGGFYDVEPYTGQDHDDLEYQCVPETIGSTNLADRRPTRALLRNGFTVDAAAYLGARWRPTVGYWADGDGDPDPWGERRIDLFLATRPVAPALVRYGVHLSPAGATASDHRLVHVDIDPAGIART